VNQQAKYLGQNHSLDTQTHQTDCFIWTTKVVSNETNDCLELAFSGGKAVILVL